MVNNNNNKSYSGHNTIETTEVYYSLIPLGISPEGMSKRPFGPEGTDCLNYVGNSLETP